MSARNSEQCSQPVIVAELFCLFDRFILLCGAENSLPERSIQVNHATLLSRMLAGMWGEEVVPMSTTMLVLLAIPAWTACSQEDGRTPHLMRLQVAMDVIARA